MTTRGTYGFSEFQRYAGGWLLSINEWSSTSPLVHISSCSGQSDLRAWSVDLEAFSSIPSDPSSSLRPSDTSHSP
nr:hypothetical protein CFP56_62898 [Quercus suber]